MRAYRGKLGYGPGPGDEVFAASFLPRREIILDTELLENAPDFIAIMAHELYHFVWRRLPNAQRQAWSELLQLERKPRHAGLSSKLRWERFQGNSSPRKWKDYVCEAFCDTAASLHSPDEKVSSHRREWFRRLMDIKVLPV